MWTVYWLAIPDFIKTKTYDREKQDGKGPTHYAHCVGEWYDTRSDDGFDYSCRSLKKVYK